MATAVELPQFGNTVEECIITRWIAREGASVSAGEVIAEIETDKTTFEITAPVGGIVLARFFEEGALVPVFTNLCVIGDVGESVERFRPQGGQDDQGDNQQGDQGDQGDNQQGDQGDQGDNRQGDQGDQGDNQQGEQGDLGNRKDQKEQSSSLISQTSLLSSSSLISQTSLLSSSSPISQTSLSSSPAWSPRATRFAAQRDFHPASITGSGPRGRVLEQDVRAAYAAAAKPSSPKRAGGARGTIARRMRESLASTAQYTLHASADATGLLAARIRNKASADLADVNVNDLIAFCTIQALEKMPELNAEFVNGEIVTHAKVHLGFACDTPRGLLVPVVRDAQDLAVGELARRMKALASQAIEGTISPDDLSGATFTISNLGGLGIESFTPVINPPQVAILGINAIQLKPLRRTGGIAFVDTIGLSLTCDHQVIDGAPGARFLQVLKEQIESV